MLWSVRSFQFIVQPVTYVQGIYFIKVAILNEPPFGMALSLKITYLKVHVTWKFMHLIHIMPHSNNEVFLLGVGIYEPYAIMT